MQYIRRYSSPLGAILLSADEVGLTGLWFEGQKHFGRGLGGEAVEKASPALEAAERWLDVYFSGQEPALFVPLHLRGTAFQMAVWDLLHSIPYGQTTTYGQIAAQLAAARQGTARALARAVGAAVGRNPISILVPCHRVVGANGSLTGYAGGVEKKMKLLQLENADTQQLSLPSRGTAL